MKVKVSAGWQLGLPETTKLYYEGDSFDAPEDLAAEWIAAGQATAVKAAKAEPESANKAEAVSANKAVTTSTGKAVTTAPKISKG